MRRRLTGSTACPQAWRWLAGPLITQETEQGELCSLCRSRAQVYSPEQPFSLRAAGVRGAPPGRKRSAECSPRAALGQGSALLPSGRGSGEPEPRPRGLGMSGLEDTPRRAPKLSSGDPELQRGHRGLPLTSSRSVFFSPDTLPPVETVTGEGHVEWACVLTLRAAVQRDTRFEDRDPGSTGVYS